jgi:hypothetical protein
MQIDREILEAAVARGELTPAQAATLLDEAGRRRAADPQRPPLEPSGWRSVAGSVAVALGAGLALAEAFEQLGFPGLAGLSSALALALLAAGWQRFTRSGGQRGQVLVCAAVLVAPLAAHAVARTVGLGKPFAASPADVLGWLGGPWFPVQAVAALSAGLALRSFRIPFLVAPLAVAAWFAAQDAAPLLFGPDPAWAQRVLVSALSGLVFLAAGVAVEGRTRGDVAFWLYLPGLLAFSGGLMTWTGASDLSLLLVGLLHAGLVLASLVLHRRAFAVAGALGMAAAAGRLADDLLDPTALSFALAGVALAVVGLGLLYHIHRARLAAQVHARLPEALQRHLPPGR